MLSAAKHLGRDGRRILRSFAALRMTAAILVAVCSLSAHASIAVSALTGHVLLPGDAPAAGVTVTVTSPALQHPRTVTTTATGAYFFDALPPGTYEVTFSKTGLSALIRPATVELGRVARADARLEPNADEDTVTSTAIPVSVNETTAITSHFSDAELDRLPLRGDRVSAVLLAPGFLGGSAPHPALRATLSPQAGRGETTGGGPSPRVRGEGGRKPDEGPGDMPDFIGHEAVEQITVVRNHPRILVRTRAGGEEFSLSIRDTWTNGEGHVFETASGGRIVSERLWFFASGWGGEEQGMNLKFTGQLGARHNLVASWLDTGREDIAALRYTGIVSERTVVDAIATEEDEFASISHVTGDHVLRAGLIDDELFVADRWSRGRWTVDAALHETSPRLATTYDIVNNGRHAFVATFGEYGDERLITAGYIGALGSTGSARVDLMRRDDVEEVQFDARYSLFGRLFTGGSYTFVYDDDSTHRGAGWVGTLLPLGEYELGATLVERYERDAWGTDFAVRWLVPLDRFRLTVAADVTNAFDSTLLEARKWRLWLRFRL
jgi:hypothetical protein